ncbi:MAG: OB-fold nucleic acid binding domain-containing protein, partial [Polyangiales bacterium]
LEALADGQEVALGGVVEAYRERVTRSGSRIAFFALEDAAGRLEVIVRPKVLATEGLRERLQSGEPLLVRGRVQREAQDGQASEIKVVLEDASELSQGIATQSRLLSLELDVDRSSPRQLETLHQALLAHPGHCTVELRLKAERGWTVRFGDVGLKVAPDAALLGQLQQLFGEAAYVLR